MPVEVVIPYAPDGAHRRQALAWVRARYGREHPGWTVTVAEAPAGPWCKATAVVPAIEASTADVMVVADADVWCDRVGDAADAVLQGVAWAVPHSNVHRFTEQGSAAVLAGEPWERQPLAERPYRGIEGGGIVVARRETLLGCPLDPRYVGWGREDLSLGIALFTLHGPPWRSSAALLHLWHPPQQRTSRKRGSAQTEALFRRYTRARRDPKAMRALLDEAKDALEPAQPHLRHHPHAAVV